MKPQTRAARSGSGGPVAPGGSSGGQTPPQPPPKKKGKSAPPPKRGPSSDEDEDDTTTTTAITNAHAATPESNSTKVPKVRVSRRKIAPILGVNTPKNPTVSLGTASTATIAATLTKRSDSVSSGLSDRGSAPSTSSIAAAAAATKRAQAKPAAGKLAGGVKGKAPTVVSKPATTSRVATTSTGRKLPKPVEEDVESDTESEEHDEDCECDDCLDEEEHDDDCDCDDCEFIVEDHDDDCDCDECDPDVEDLDESLGRRGNTGRNSRVSNVLSSLISAVGGRARSLRSEPAVVQEYVKLKTQLDEMFMADDNEEIKYFKDLPESEQSEVLGNMKNRLQLTASGIPMRFQIMQHVKEPEIQRVALSKYDAICNMEPGSPEYFKMTNWLDGFMRIPFDSFNNLPVSLSDGDVKCREFMHNVSSQMNAAIYGQEEAKLQVMQFVAQWISNPTSAGNVLALHGPAGVGKTTLIKEGVAKALGRPFHFIALGGATDSSFLEGHSYTYEGSVWGRLVDILMTSKCMNPVIFFDELDKVSSTPKGEEIINILMHLTDSAQNERICDKYFAGIPLDFSKCLFFFSLNNPELVNPVLLDRAYTLGIAPPDTKAKVVIARDYIMPGVLQSVSLGGMVNMSDGVIETIITDYTKREAGVRELRRCVQTIASKLNMLRFMNTKELPFYIKGFKLPYTVSAKDLPLLLSNPKPAIDPSIAHLWT